MAERWAYLSQGGEVLREAYAEGRVLEIATAPLRRAPAFPVHKLPRPVCDAPDDGDMANKAGGGHQ